MSGKFGTRRVVELCRSYLYLEQQKRNYMKTCNISGLAVNAWPFHNYTRQTVKLIIIIIGATQQLIGRENENEKKNGRNVADRLEV